jgi:hypothetical protein
MSSKVSNLGLDVLALKEIRRDLELPPDGAVRFYESVTIIDDSSLVPVPLRFTSRTGKPDRQEFLVRLYGRWSILPLAEKGLPEKSGPVVQLYVAEKVPYQWNYETQRRFIAFPAWAEAVAIATPSEQGETWAWRVELYMPKK